MTDRSTSPRCGNNPNARLTDGDRKAVADLKEYLANRAAVERVRAVLETEAVVGRSALEYRGLIVSALMAAEPAAAGPDQTRPSCPDPIECGHEAALGEAQAAVERVRSLANGEYYGITGRAFLAALDGPERTEPSC